MDGYLFKAMTLAFYCKVLLFYFLHDTDILVFHIAYPRVAKIKTDVTDMYAVYFISLIVQ